MTSIQSKQIRQIQTICSKRFSDRNERLNFMSEFFNKEITSTLQLSYAEADDLIFFLNTGKSPDSSFWALFDRNNKQHTTVLSLAHQLRWVLADKTWLVDLNRLGNWIKSERCPVNKPLKQMNKEELSKVIFAMENISRKKFKS